MLMQRFLVSCGFCAAVALTGCSGTESTTTVRLPEPQDASQFLTPEEPEGAVDVAEVRDDAADGDEVVVVGRIGGEKDPWVEGLAAFNLVDVALKPCNEIPGDQCPVPWDYCCEPDLAANRVLVKIVDEEGSVVPTGAKELLELDELETVVVQGTARRDDAGNVSLLATKIHVKP